MNVSSFDYTFDSSQIALEALANRSEARMMRVCRPQADRAAVQIEHARFKELPRFLHEGDLLVFNTSQVLPARFFARRKTGALLEGLLLQDPNERVPLQFTGVWIKGKVRENEAILFEGLGDVRVARREEKEVWLEVPRIRFVEYLRLHGVTPLPPYILAERKRRALKALEARDREDYQSILAEASQKYSVAAPTASLHFDEALLDQLRASGIQMAFLKLHVGEGTFAPMETQKIDDHQMHFEEAEIPNETWELIEKARAKNRRVIAVGTTVLRALESAEAGPGKKFSTQLFIKPGFHFRRAQGLITNFHWPKSTLLVLVASFLEAETSGADGFRHLWKDVYKEAVSQSYRLFSFGDGMLIL